MLKLEKYTLYYNSSCPFCVRVLNVLRNIKVTLSLKNTSETPEYRRELVVGGGSGMIPCLLHPDGTWQYESSDIIAFLQEKANISK